MVFISLSIPTVCICFYSLLKIAALSLAVPTIQVFTKSMCIGLLVTLPDGEEL